MIFKLAPYLQTCKTFIALATGHVVAHLGLEKLEP